MSQEVTSTLEATDLSDGLDITEAREAIARALMTPPAGRIPASTYRVQFDQNFTFRDARALVPHLRALGVDTIYTSPYFHARSAHGYDINNHNEVNPALGTEEEFQAFLEELSRHGIGHVMDVVPNHMGVAGGSNPWWNDVLENGQSSAYASFFDIDWHPIKTGMEGQVLLPILGDQYGEVLERGELQLQIQDGALSLSYYDLRLPIAPRTYRPVLEEARLRLAETLPEDDPSLIELESILTALSHLPGRDEVNPERVRERLREKEVMKRRLAALSESSSGFREAWVQAIDAFNGTPGDPSSFDQLDALVSAQPYRLAFWRVAAEEINYRRFFDINDLAAIRMEEPEVFAESHRMIMRLVAEGNVTGLRVDHPDGLWDPAGYFMMLQHAATVARAERLLAGEEGLLSDEDRAVLEGAATGMRDEIAAARPLYVVAEKIVSHGEKLPTSWPIHGTTGYEFLNQAAGLFVDRASEKTMTELYRRFSGLDARYDELVYQSKRNILRYSLVSELTVLADSLDRVSDRNRHYRDFTLGSLSRALREVIAAFPVYRTYIGEETEEITPRDRSVIEQAIWLARRRNSEMDSSIFRFLRNLLLLELPVLSEEEKEAQRRFIMRLQQLTGPVMAKGLEDTTFYIFNRLTSLNEVGGEPQHFGVSPDEFHMSSVERQRFWPHTLLASSTHDTKRSEDVRARISVLSELPKEWQAALGRWSKRNRSKKTLVDDQLLPDRNDEYLYYQSLLGAWPLESMSREVLADFTERMVAYMAKAAKESKVHTSWINANPDYDAALEKFVRATLADEKFVADLLPLQTKVAAYGALNALSQITLKFTSPGVPDLYQGNQVWNFSLVDPDNRRPIDYGPIIGMLETLEQGWSAPSDLVDQWRDGRIKLWVTHRALAHRRDNPALYQQGDYQPLRATGPAGQHVVSFTREVGTQRIVVAVPRLVARLSGGADEPTRGGEPWIGTALPVPSGHYRNVFTNQRLTSSGQIGVEQLFADFPVALLERLDS